MNHNTLILNSHLTIILILICCLNLTYCLSDSKKIPKDLFTDVSIHEGYNMKYSFKDHNYIDILLIPQFSTTIWLAVIIDKNDTGENRISLQKYNGEDFDQDENDPIDIGNCKKINSMEYFKFIFITVSKCDNTSTTDIMVVPELPLSLVIMQTLPHAFVEDAQFWKNSTGALNLVVLVRQNMASRSSGILYHYALNNELRIFNKIGLIKNTDPRSVTIFDINHISYLAVANYHDISGGFIKSNIYAQDLNSGRLIKHQQLTTKGTLSLTYICFDGTTRKEHFLLAANNRKLKGQPEMKNTIDSFNIEESILFKWDNTNFIPFQTLLVRLPSPWILVHDKKNVIILLTWSYVDGIISYQYDGWRFKRTAIEQKDITNDSHDFVSLRQEFIEGELLFTIPNSKVGAKRKYYIPVYKNNATTRTNYLNKEEWCENTYIELQHVWNEFSPHYQYLLKLNNLSNQGPAGIMAIFDLMFGPKISSGINKGKNLEVMSLIGPNNFDNIQSKSSHQECTSDIHMTRLSGIEHVVGTKNGFLALDQSGKILFYPISQWIINNSTVKGIVLNTFKAGTKILRFQTMKLCHHLGLYAEVEYGGKLLGHVYNIHDSNKLILKRALPLNGPREVETMCIKNIDCFLIMPSEGDPTSICTLVCDHLNTSFSCDFKSKAEIVNVNNESIIVGVGNNAIYKLIINNKRHLKINKSIKDVKHSSKILLKAVNQQFIIVIFGEEEIQICRLHKEDQNKELICHNGITLPSNYQHLELGFINKEPALFIGTHKHIWMNSLSSNHSVKLLDLGNIRYKSFKPFQIENLNFIVLKEGDSSTMIKVADCKP